MKTLTRLAMIVAALSLSLQFYGCSDSEIKSAKLYRQQRKFPKADEMLLQALKSDPRSDEGWALYVQNLYDLQRYERIADVIDTARLYAIKFRSQVEEVRHNTWIYLYNSGLKVFQENPDSKERQRDAIALLESAKKVAPEQPETYELLGDVYFAGADTPKAMGVYEEALRQVRSQHEQGVSLGITLRMSPESVEKAIGGAPSSKSKVGITASDSAVIYSYRSNEGFFYFEKSAKPPYGWELTGWRFTSNESVGLQPMRVSTNTYLNLASYYYAQGNMALAAGNKSKAEDYYNKVVPLLISIQRLDPSDENAANIIPDIYAKLEQPDKAKSMYKKMLSEHPSKQLYAAYGAVLLRSNDFQGGVDAYQNALKLDPAFENALYNLGVAYQNWAAADQKANPKADVSAKLKSSVNYYEQVHSVDPKEYNSLVNLYSLYDVLADKDKKAKTLAALESLKSTEVAKDKNYWHEMMKIYAANKNSKAAEEALRMHDSLK